MADNISEEYHASWTREITLNRALGALNVSSPIKGEKLECILEALKVDKTLEDLDLRCCGIGDEWAKRIAGALSLNTALLRLSLGGNHVGDEGAIAFADALRFNNVLDTLDLSHNKIGDEGAKVLAYALRVNNALDSLQLSYNKIGDEGRKALISASIDHGGYVHGIDKGLQMLDSPDDKIGEK